MDARTNLELLQLAFKLKEEYKIPLEQAVLKIRESQSAIRDSWANWERFKTEPSNQVHS